MYNIEELNEIQKRAVLDTEGAVLVTAGAGSGKTRLLTHRIAHLIKDLNVPPYNILAITFTNKAANEMRTRLANMLNDEALNISGYTFHGVCLRILRRFIDRLNGEYNKNFTIYGESEIKSVIKRLCKEYEVNDDLIKKIITEISNAKNNKISPSEYSSIYKFSQHSEEISNIYAQYQEILKQNNAVDFDDMLLLAYKLLTENDEVREYYQNRYSYIHIDEFQDTNEIQYEIVKIMAGKHGNIFAVGDEDQCIYTWRGASIKNIFQFQKDFNCKLYKLEQNYRSTNNILTVANRIIKGNTQRLDKKLWTDNSDGEKVVCFGAAADGFEADYVVKTIYELIHDGVYNYSDCAVLLRLNALTRPFEERFMQYGIPHKVYGGFKFYDRKEIKDVLAYARLSANPADDEALYRIINFPRRGIGESSIEKMRDYSKSTGMSAFEVVMKAQELPFPSALKAKLLEFANTLNRLRAAAEGNVIEYFKYLLFGVLNVVNLFSEDDDDRARLENINELVNSVREFIKMNEGATVADYLQTVSLYSDTDDMNGDNAVTLATVHSAKGLEFPVVFVVGLEDGTFPSLRMGEDTSSHIEEERRLMYVAVTRARKRLFLSYSKSRFLYGETRYNIPSRFLVECGLVARPDDMSTEYYSSSRQSYRGVGGFAKSSANLQTKSTPTQSFASADKFTGSYKSNFGKNINTDKKTATVSGDKGEFAVGVTVMHKRLGKGKILSLENMGAGVYAKIDFENGGVMLLAVDYAPITVVKE